MLTTGAISTIQRPQGGICARKSAAAALLIFFLFAGFFSTAPRASADTGIAAADAMAATAASAAEVPPAPTPVPSLETGNGAPAVSADPPQPAQDAATAQSAAADAAAAQPQQSNVVIIIRINSPGDDVVSQTNVVSVVAVGANQGSTTQNPATGASAPETSAPATTAPLAPGTSAPATAAPTQSPSSAAPAPLPDAQPAQSSNAGRRLVEHPATVVQQLGPQARRALSILTFTASSIAAAPSSGHLTASTTASAAPVRSGSADSPSRVFESNTGAMGSSEKSVDSAAASVGTARRLARPTEAHSSRAGTLGAVRDDFSRWLGRTRVAARPQLTADPAGGMSLGLLTLTALLLGVLGWAALTWPPLTRR